MTDRIACVVCVCVCFECISGLRRGQTDEMRFRYGPGSQWPAKRHLVVVVVRYIYIYFELFRSRIQCIAWSSVCSKIICAQLRLCNCMGFASWQRQASQTMYASPTSKCINSLSHTHEKHLCYTMLTHIGILFSTFNAA